MTRNKDRAALPAGIVRIGEGQSRQRDDRGGRTDIKNLDGVISTDGRRIGTWPGNGQILVTIGLARTIVPVTLKVIVAPDCAAAITARSEPFPLSFRFVTTFPESVGVLLGVEVLVGVFVGENVLVAVFVDVLVGVLVKVNVLVGVRVVVLVNVFVRVGVFVRFGDDVLVCVYAAEPLVGGGGGGSVFGGGTTVFGRVGGGSPGKVGRWAGKVNVGARRTLVTPGWTNKLNKLRVSNDCTAGNRFWASSIGCVLCASSGTLSCCPVLIVRV